MSEAEAINFDIENTESIISEIVNEFILSLPNAKIISSQLCRLALFFRNTLFPDKLLTDELIAFNGKLNVRLNTFLNQLISKISKAKEEN